MISRKISHLFVIPAKAGTQGPQRLERLPWTAPFAGATTPYSDHLLHFEPGSENGGCKNAA
jgi:hypothetical protein